MDALTSCNASSQIAPLPPQLRRCPLTVDALSEACTDPMSSPMS
jgi:hypothetical protein